jgi:hypothetical protein
MKKFPELQEKNAKDFVQNELPSVLFCRVNIKSKQTKSRWNSHTLNSQQALYFLRTHFCLVADKMEGEKYQRKAKSDAGGRFREFCRGETWKTVASIRHRRVSVHKIYPKMSFYTENLWNLCNIFIRASEITSEMKKNCKCLVLKTLFSSSSSRLGGKKEEAKPDCKYSRTFFVW